MTNEIKSWVDRMPCPPGTGESRVGYMQAEIDELRAKVESLSADAERMDWLDQNIFSTGMDDLDKKIHCGMWAWRTFAPEGVKGSARNIISSAMAKEKSK